nr:unnamed protein product [Callosobruchus chinensis]
MASVSKLPADPVRRGIWFSLLGIESPTKLPKVTLICSKHFDIKYVKYDLAGKRHLKDGADPLDSCSLEYEQGYASSDSTASPSKEIEAFSPSSETRSGVGSPVRKWESRYVGDMSLDCCSPVRAKKTSMNMINTITVQRQKIDGLERTVRSLGQRVRTLKDLIQLLKRNHT